MRRRPRLINSLEHSIFQRTLRLLENSFHQAVIADEPFVKLRDSLNSLENSIEFPFFDWAPIEIAFESVLSKERTISNAAYRTARDILGL
jgi:hypothetical protein